MDLIHRNLRCNRKEGDVVYAGIGLLPPTAKRLEGVFREVSDALIGNQKSKGLQINVSTKNKALGYVGGIEGCVGPRPGIRSVGRSGDCWLVVGLPGIWTGQ